MGFVGISLDLRSITRKSCVCLALLACLATCSANNLSAQPPSAAEDQLDRYLQRLALDDLRILHLSNELNNRVEESARTRLGKKLADLYADKLMNLGDDTQDYQTTLTEVRRLIATIPNANSASLQVMLQQAEYLRAEEFINKWLEDRQDGSARNEAMRILNDVVANLSEQLTQLREKMERLNREIPNIEDDSVLARLEEELRSSEVVQLRATYYSGWANYYSGILLSDEDEARERLKVAEESFRIFVDVEGQTDITRIDSTWLDLESGLQVRGFAGLGMTLAALGQKASAEHVFGLILESDAPASALQEAPIWQLQAWLNANQPEQAVSLASGFVRSFVGKATRDQTRYCVALVRYAARPPRGVDVPESMTATGLEGLVRLRQFRLIQELTQQYSLSINTTDNFYLLWVQGNLAFAKGEETSDPVHYEKATQWFEMALALPEAHNDPRSQGHCQYQLGWSLFLTDRFEKAADEFEKASLLLKTFDEETAVNAAWKRYECFRQLAESDTRFQTMAIESLRAIEIGFPDSRLAKTASYHLSRLDRSEASLEQNIASLEAIAPDDEQYLSARYELCLLYHQQWSTARSRNESTDEFDVQLLRAVERFLEVSGSDLASQRVKVSLLLVDTGLRSDPRRMAYAKSYLNAASRDVDKLSDSHAVAAEFHYQEFQIARLEGNDQRAASEAEWLVKNAPSSVYVMSALVLIAQSTDQALKGASAQQRPALVDKALDAYERLVRLLGSDVSTLQENKNARVSLYRLGQLLREKGKPSDAAQHFERLLESNESSEVYLRAAGLAWFEASRYDSALPHWRKLTVGLRRGEDGWLEAKYHVIACLENTNREEAQRVLKQFRLLYPAGKANNWEDEFRELERRLGS